MVLPKKLRELLKRLHEEDESGVVMTEFAVAFPLQLFVTLAIMQFSLILVAHVMVEHAAFAGARAALVADVAPPGQQALTGTNLKDAQKAAAKRAACFVLNPIAPGSDVDPGGPDPAAIHFASGDRSKGAYDFTVIPDIYDHDGYIGLTVQHAYVMEIPVVNHWFALANKGSFWYGPGADSPLVFNAASNQHNRTCLLIEKTVFLPRPWKGY